ncbi:MAG: insulinase family protein [Caldilineae bacterium]|nr:MAG: insulinase family protein [Caldilineae bacterium]
MLTDDLYKTTLDNGLVVLMREVHSAPVASLWVWYRVGSRNEVPGSTGLSHWVEHMLFKSTRNYPQGNFDRMIEREGGYFNGMTWLDWTTYYETLPADRLEIALKIESERMVNALFLPEETESERTVIIAEREGGENRPTYLLFEQVQALSFLAHPYQHMVIGWKEDLQSITRDQLYQHYRTYYVPNNAIVVAVGDFHRQALLDQIAAHFGSIPAGELPAPVSVREPAPRAERRVYMHGPGDTAYIDITYRVPQATHPDFFALVVLDAILDGAKGMPPFGNSALGRAARLYRALVNRQLATRVHTSVGATIDPYLLTISATVHPRSSLQEVERAILEEIERVQSEPVGEEELARAIKGARVQFVYGSETVTNQAMWLGLAELVASGEWLAGFLDSLAAVTADDIRRVAQTYLTPANRVVGWYEPEGGAA